MSDNQGGLFGPDSDGILLSYQTCTASLILKDNIKFVILTAAHCLVADYGVESILNLPYKGRGVMFDPDRPSLTPPLFRYWIQGGVEISSKSYWDGTTWNSGKGFIVNNPLDAGIIVFPINAQNALGETLSSRYGDLQPVKLISDAGVTLDQLTDSPNLKGLPLTEVGYGYSFIMTGGKPYTDRTTFGKRNVGPLTVLHSTPNLLFTYDDPNSGTRLGPGDSGSPQFVEIGGNMYQTSVLSTANSVWGKSYGLDTAGYTQSGLGRLDRPIAQALLNCAKNASGATFEEQVASIQACVNSNVR